MKISFHKRFEQFLHNQNLQRNVELVVDALLVVIIVLFIIRPAISSISAMNKSKEEAEALLVQLEEKRGGLEDAQELLGELRDTLPLYEDAFPDEPKQFDLFNTLRVAAEREEVVLEQLTHLAGNPGQVTFTITGGGTYAQITDYVSLLERMPRLFTLENIMITKSDINDEAVAPRLSVSINGIGYYYDGEVELLHESDQLEN